MKVGDHNGDDFMSPTLFLITVGTLLFVFVGAVAGILFLILELWIWLGWT